MVLFSIAFVEGESIEASMHVKVDGKEQDIPVGLLEYKDFDSTLGSLVDTINVLLYEHENVMMEAAAEDKRREGDG